MLKLEGVTLPAAEEEGGAEDGKASDGVRPVGRLVPVMEGGVAYSAPVGGGQKTGFYFDQRENRAMLRALCASLAAAGRPPKVADLCCYQGGFTISAALGGAGGEGGGAFRPAGMYAVGGACERSALQMLQLQTPNPTCWFGEAPAAACCVGAPGAPLLSGCPCLPSPPTLGRLGDPPLR